MEATPPQSSQHPHYRPKHDLRAVGTFQTFFAQYFWFIFKNVVGWIFIIASPVLGVVVPGPGGIPLFLIGFALVTFPGKRRLTSRMLSGKSLPLDSPLFMGITAFIAVLITAGVIWAFSYYYERLLEKLKLTPSIDFIVAMVVLCIAAFIVTWVVFRLALRVTNWVIRKIPLIRRFVRPILRKWGIHLLPTRRKRNRGGMNDEQDEILKFSDAYEHNARYIWLTLKPWMKRVIGLGITIWIFTIMIDPLQKNWPLVKERAQEFSIVRFFIASVMFAMFLFFFRAMSWWRVLKGFGFKLPRAAATRIWSTSELARYLPGAIWQVVGRVYLIKPYGVSGSICSTTQILEVCVFLFSNVLLASLCLLWFGAKIDETARPWLYTAMALVPLLGLLLHPKIFYAIVNKVLTRLGKPKIVKRLRGYKLIKLLFIVTLGLLWQTAALYVITEPVLHLKPDWWWAIAGSYCLGWMAGFLAFWAPGGIGVRELVFVATLQLVLPDEVKNSMNPDSLNGLLVLIGFVLRLWTVAGEILLTMAAYALDFQGAINDPDAPGRVQQTRVEPDFIEA